MSEITTQKLFVSRDQSLILRYLPNSAVTANSSSFFIKRSLGDTPLREYPCHGQEAAAFGLSFGDTITFNITENSSVHISGEQT